MSETMGINARADSERTALLFAKDWTEQQDVLIPKY